MTQLLRAEVRNEIDPAAGLRSSLNKKKERSQSDSDAARKHQITQSVRQHFLYFLLYLETVLSLMLPHLCTATRVRGTWRSLLGEKKHVERQSVSQTDRQTDRVHIVSSWRLRSG